MLYKTITLQLLEARPQLHEQLRKKRMLLTTLDRLANQLKEFHTLWKDRLLQAKPGCSPSQIASEALELALKNLEELLPPESPQDASDPLSLDKAMAFVRNHTPRA